MEAVLVGRVPDLAGLSIDNVARRSPELWVARLVGLAASHRVPVAAFQSSI